MRAEPIVSSLMGVCGSLIRSALPGTMGAGSVDFCQRPPEIPGERSDRILGDACNEACVQRGLQRGLQRGFALCCVLADNVATDLPSLPPLSPLPSLPPLPSPVSPAACC